ncbi:hypothetical protein [Bacillus cereus]|uniref:hypothetical protein n=1 Tax=Bacillus cereus TaxID=1396 RepID=UPI0037FCBAA1
MTTGRLRGHLIKKVKVLDRAKGLLMLPDLEYATVQQVADFYEVSPNNIQPLINEYTIELSWDCLALFN